MSSGVSLTCTVATPSPLDRSTLVPSAVDVTFTTRQGGAFEDMDPAMNIREDDDFWHDGSLRLSHSASSLRPVRPKGKNFYSDF